MTDVIRLCPGWTGRDRCVIAVCSECSCIAFVIGRRSFYFRISGAVTDRSRSTGMGASVAYPRFPLKVFLQRVRIARNAERCTS